MSVSRKKQFEIIKASKRSKNIKGFIVGRGGGKRLAFGKSGGLILHDAGIANEIEQKYGNEGSKDVVVVEVDDLDTAAENRGGKSTRKSFVINAPWKD